MHLVLWLQFLGPRGGWAPGTGQHPLLCSPCQRVPVGGGESSRRWAGLPGSRSLLPLWPVSFALSAGNRRTQVQVPFTSEGRYRSSPTPVAPLPPSLLPRAVLVSASHPLSSGPCKPTAPYSVASALTQRFHLLGSQGPRAQGPLPLASGQAGHSEALEED